ncbi:MAG: hypothetical protein G01um101424_280 [Parcubacteria group bacterium Gr01-1014_24]|nr:MAG: hypothetical protein G01um101424_280 [Parcubacteria group bacterium Gr01-1014_24]
MKNYFIGFAVLVIFFVSYHSWTAVNFDNIKYVRIAGQNIKVELALTEREQEKGLSGRSGLEEDKGMLFVFSAQGGFASGGDKANHPRFWMKDMNFAIDIIWIGEDLRIVYIKKDARPESYPETFGSDQNSKYVLEVIAGFADKNNLKKGDRVKLVY